MSRPKQATEAVILLEESVRCKEDNLGATYPTASDTRSILMLSSTVGECATRCRPSTIQITTFDGLITVAMAASANEPASEDLSS